MAVLPEQSGLTIGLMQQVTACGQRLPRRDDRWTAQHERGAGECVPPLRKVVYGVRIVKKTVNIPLAEEPSPISDVKVGFGEQSFGVDCVMRFKFYVKIR